MLLPSSGSLEGDVIAQVGQDGLALVCARCGQHFSLADLKREIAAMPEGNEKDTMATIAGIVEGAHQQVTGRVQKPNTKA